MAFRGMGRCGAAVVATMVLVAGCSAADAEDPEDPTSSTSAEAPTDAGTASAEAGSDDEDGASGNSEADGPAADDSAPPTPDPNRPEAQLPPRPDAMDEHTVDGAIAAGKYFMQLYPYVYATGDLSEWDALSDDGCGFCNNSREHADELHSSGGYMSGGDVEIYSEDGGGPYEEGAYVVELGIRFEEATHFSGDGTETRYSAEDRPSFVLSVLWRDGAWVVTGVRTQTDEGGGP